jgi:F-type H+-transporting ATPase subunit b
MLIDWFAVGAQALNFLILVWLMKHFLYQPVLNAIDGREKKIAAELADAATKKAEAEKDRDDFQKKNEDFDRERVGLLTKASDEANAERQRLLGEARKSADELSAKRQEKLRSDTVSLQQTLVRKTQEEVFSIARKTLSDLATTELEERMVAVFTHRLGEMNGEARKAMESAIRSTMDPSIVRSAFALPASERAKVQNAINETFSLDVHLRFETSPDLVSGIELTANGQKIAWSIADYLTSLEERLGELLKQQNNPEPNAAPKPEAKTETKLVVEPATSSKATTETKAVKPAAVAAIS